MAVLLRLQQIRDPHHPQTDGKWFARAVHVGTTHTNSIAEMMQANCTLKKSDILAVICELTETIKHELNESRSVHLDGLGTFKMCISSNAVEHREDFSLDNDVRSVRISFTPERHLDAYGQSHWFLTDDAKMAMLK